MVHPLYGTPLSTPFPQKIIYYNLLLASKLITNKILCATIPTQKEVQLACYYKMTPGKGKAIVQYMKGVIVGKWKDKQAVLCISSKSVVT